MYKLAVADKVVVPVRFSLQDGKKIKPFAFTLECDRMTRDEWRESVKDPHTGVPSDEKIAETMKRITVGWQNQTLVLDEAGEPAAFCEEACDVMFSTAGVLDVAVSSYLKEAIARAKN